MANKLIYDLQRFGMVIKCVGGDGQFVKFSPTLETSAGNGKDDIISVAYTTSATLESGATMDPLAVPANPEVPPQPWRLRIETTVCDWGTFTESNVTNSDPGFIRIYATHPYQLPSGDTDKNTVAYEYGGSNADHLWARKAGELTCGFLTGAGTYVGGIPAVKSKTTVPFLSRVFDHRFAPLSDQMLNSYGNLSAHPLSYMLSVTDRGVAFVAWQEDQDMYGDRFSWFVIQRPVDPVTGVTLAKESAPPYAYKNPVFCVYSIGGGHPNDTQPMLKRAEQERIDPWTNDEAKLGEDKDPYVPARIYRFTVRETDVYKPTTPVIATLDSPDCRAVINAKQQVAIAENGQYVIFYPNGFNTARYVYRDEVDMLTYTSADVISQWLEISITPYPGKTRSYKACQSNLPNNKGMRILLLVDEASISRSTKESDWHNPPIV